jgi:hypothetical protein
MGPLLDRYLELSARSVSVVSTIFLIPAKKNQFWVKPPRHSSLFLPLKSRSRFLPFIIQFTDTEGTTNFDMASDEIIWQVINQQFCSYKLKHVSLDSSLGG